MARTKDYEYGKGTKYGDGTKVLITDDCRRWKIGGNFTHRVGTVTFGEAWFVDADGSKELISSNYPTIKIGRFWKIKGIECFWMPLEEAKKALEKEGYVPVIEKNRLKKTVKKSETD